MTTRREFIQQIPAAGAGLSLLRQAKLTTNYALYEVIPGIYQVRGFDLSDISFVRAKPDGLSLTR